MGKSTGVSTYLSTAGFVLQLSTQLRFQSSNYYTANIWPVHMACWHPLYGTAQVAHRTGNRTVRVQLHYPDSMVWDTVLRLP